MKNISKKILKRMLACFMVCALAMVPITPSKASENEQASYTVEFNNASSVYICNKKATAGPIILTYTVESASGTIGNNGIVATTVPEEADPYTGTKGSFRFYRHNQMLQEGTYSLELSLMPNNASYRIAFSNVEDNGATIALPAGDHNWDDAQGSPDYQYYGIYISGPASAKLVNVTCVDAEGNDLELQSNNSAVVITKNVQEEPEQPQEPAGSAGYTVEFNNVSSVYICNKKATAGPIILTYTVESASGTIGNNGIVATTAPEEADPYTGTKGSFRFYRHNQMLQEGTYSLELSLMPNNASYRIAFSNVEDNGATIALPAGDHNWDDAQGSPDYQYYGIYISGPASAKLVNVTCVDAEGNDLELQSNNSAVVITKNVQEEPEQPQEPAGSAGYTVEFNNASSVYICNKKATAGPIILTYTVESASGTIGNNGIVATTAPEEADPYTGTKGSFRYYRHNQMLQEGTYSLELSLMPNNASYRIAFSNVEDNGATIALPAGDHNWDDAQGSPDYQYYGIYISGPASAKLVNVTCVDAEGNDLELQSNNSAVVITKNVQEEPEQPQEPAGSAGYTVEFNNASSVYICNKKATAGPIILTYTVESASGTIGNNGIVATTAPEEADPYTGTKGSFRYYRHNQMLQEGTYSLELSLMPNNASYRIAFSNVEDNGATIALPAGDHNWDDAQGSPDYQYYGIYISGPASAKLVNVTCVDAEGNDLELQSNNSAVVITKNGAQEELSVAFKTVQPAITDSIALTYKVQVVGNLPQGTVPTMTFEMNDVVSDAVEGSLVAETTDIYTFTYEDIMAQQMSDVITATVMVGDVSEVKEYSVEQYCKAVLGKAASDLGMTANKKAALDTLVVDLLKYGMVVQEYRGEAVTVELTPEQLALGTQGGSLDNLAGIVTSKLEGTADNNYAWRSVSLVLRDKINIRCKFTATDISNLVVKVAMNGETITKNADDFVSTGKANEYYVYFENIYAYEYEEAITFSFENNEVSVGQTLNYSVNTYLDAKKASTDVKLVKLLLAINNYGDAALSYVSAE